jgi:hypothetical protein
MPNILNNLAVTGSLTAGGTAIFFGNYISTSGSLVVAANANITRNLNVTGSGLVDGYFITNGDLTGSKNLIIAGSGIITGSFAVTGSFSANTVTTGSLFSSGCATVANSMLVSGSLTTSGSIGGRNLSGINTGDTLNNLLINGGFDFQQRGSGSTINTITGFNSDKYGSDCWKMFNQTSASNCTMYRKETAYDSPIVSAHYGEFFNTSGSGKFAIGQPLEWINSWALRGKTVSFQCKLAGDGTTDIVKIGIVWGNINTTRDSLTNPFISSWGGSSINPTLATNYTLLTSASLTLSTVPTIISASGIIPTTSVNIICMIWNDAGWATSKGLIISDAGLYETAIIQNYSTKPVQQEFAMCQRTCQKTWNRDIVPGTAGDPLGLYVISVNSPSVDQTAYGSANYKVPLRIPAVPTLYGYSGGKNKVSVGGVDQAANSGATTFFGENSFAPYNNSGGNVTGAQVQFHYFVECGI